MTARCMPNVGACVRVRSLRRVFAPVGRVVTVTKAEAAALIALGNAEAVRDDSPGSVDTYARRDMRAEESNREHRRKTPR